MSHGTLKNSQAFDLARSGKENVHNFLRAFTAITSRREKIACAGEITKRNIVKTNKFFVFFRAIC